jgi:hypothetical protein
MKEAGYVAFGITVIKYDRVILCAPRPCVVAQI